MKYPSKIDESKSLKEIIQQLLLTFYTLRKVNIPWLYFKT